MLVVSAIVPRSCEVELREAIASRHRDRQFESGFLQRGVACEPENDIAYSGCRAARPSPSNKSRIRSWRSGAIWQGLVFDISRRDASTYPNPASSLVTSEAPKNAWQKRQNTWEIEPWLELLPFSTRPDAVIEGLTKVKAFYGAGSRFHEATLQP
jgi:hypothetical protein